MPIGPHLSAWRLSRTLTVERLAEQAGVPAASVEAIEADELDPPASTLDALAGALAIPPAWLYTDPRHLALLFADPDGEPTEIPTDSVDPLGQRILLAAGQDRTLFVLLATLLQSGDAKLVRAAEMSLRSLVKQSRQASVPWQSRPPGHFEPPSD